MTKPPTTITVTFTFSQYRLVMRALCERRSKVHPCDREPDTFGQVTDIMLDAVGETSKTCTADDDALATCLGGNGRVHSEAAS